MAMVICPECTRAHLQFAKGTLLSIQKLIKEPLGRICTQQCADHEMKLAARQIVSDAGDEYNPPACLIASALLKFMQHAAYMHLDLALSQLYGSPSTHSAREQREYYTKAVAYDVVVHLKRSLHLSLQQPPIFHTY